MRQAHRLSELPPYLFEEIDRKIKKARESGTDIISFGIGDPDLPTPEHIIRACKEAVRDPSNHKYPSSRGKRDFREAVAYRIKKDRGVVVDPEVEVTSLIGSKEGIHNIHMAYIDQGDVVLYPDPGYPVYRISPGFCGGLAYPMPLEKENGFIPDLQAIPDNIVKRAKIMWINYPNNPTTATAEKQFYREVVDFAKEKEIILCSDEAYSAISFDGYRPPSLLEYDTGRKVGVVFNSLSKTYNMTGWRIGYAAGCEEIVESLVKLKGNVDSGTCGFIQDAGTTALTYSQKCVEDNIQIYKRRRDIFVKGLKDLGYELIKPRATFYLWMEVPDSMSFVSKLLDVGVIATPGVGFGKSGEGYVRYALTQPEERIEEALKRMGGIN